MLYLYLFYRVYMVQDSPYFINAIDLQIFYCCVQSLFVKCDMKHIRRCIKWIYYIYILPISRGTKNNQDGFERRRCPEADQTYDGLHRAGGQREGRGDRRQGGGGVQHREGAARAAAEAQDHGVLREEGEAGGAAEENSEQQHAQSGDTIYSSNQRQ